jgi:hypothetical protein
MSAVRGVCLSAETTDPWAVALEIMRLPAVNLHGPEHHVIIGSALMTAYSNATGTRDKLAKSLGIIEKRGTKVPGGTCGFWGACGAGLGAGIFLAVVTESTPLSADTYGLCNRLTARCLAAIGEVGGPRCCKRNVGIALRETVAFLREELGVALTEPAIACEFSGKNRECIGKKCAWNVN